jgi:hypothetical protein
MSISVKISQLNEGGAVNSTDQIPISRGASETLRIPASQFVVNGTNIGVGTGQLYFDRSTGSGTTLQFRSLSGAEGISVSNQGNTLVISASGQNPVRNAITGNGTTRTFTINGATSVNPNNYRVDIDGVLQEPIADYSISGSTIVFVDAPPNGSKVTVISNNLVRVFDVIPSDGSVTPQKLSPGGPFWNTAGNVGIGITTPFTVLNTLKTIPGGSPATSGSVDDNVIARFGGGVVAFDIGARTEGTMWIQPRLFNNFSSNFSLSLCPNGGNVGIGTVAPNQTLTVVGSISATGNLSIGDATLSTPAGSAPIFGVRAWVVFNGTGTGAGTATIISQGNVSNVSRVSTGIFDITFAINLPSTTYGVLGTPSWTAGSAVQGVTLVEAGGNPVLKTTSQCRVQIVSTGGASSGSGTTSVMFIG